MERSSSSPLPLISLSIPPISANSNSSRRRSLVQLPSSPTQSDAGALSPFRAPSSNSMSASQDSIPETNSGLTTNNNCASITANDSIKVICRFRPPRSTNPNAPPGSVAR